MHLLLRELLKSSKTESLKIVSVLSQLAFGVAFICNNTKYILWVKLLPSDMNLNTSTRYIVVQPLQSQHSL